MLGWRLQVGALAILMWTGTAIADENTERANRLFDEGKAILDKDLDGACAKFEESLQFNAQAIGTLLNVALCDEKRGRYASAMAKFTEARDRAKEQDLDVHRKAAEEHLLALGPRVPHVTITFSEPPQPGTTIVIDEKLIPFDSIANHPIDPGPHDVVVVAPGHVAYKARFEATEGKPLTLPIPRLEKSVGVKRSRRTIGKVMTVGGLAALGTGVVLGIVAKRQYDSATENCNRITVDGNKVWQCESPDFAASGDAHALGTVGTVFGGIGLAAIGIGAVLWLRGSSVDQRVTVVPQVGPEGPGIAAVGHF